MRKLVIAILFMLSVATVVSARDTYVNGYYRKDGTYVQGHYKTPQNNNFYDNYSSQGNRNPYTGQKGYKKNPNLYY